MYNNIMFLRAFGIVKRFTMCVWFVATRGTL